MTDTFAHVTIRLLEKEYQVSCPADERANLLASVELLNRKMREIRDSGKVVGPGPYRDHGGAQPGQRVAEASRRRATAGKPGGAAGPGNERAVG